MRNRSTATRRLERMCLHVSRHAAHGVQCLDQSGQTRAGKLRALAVTTATRSEALPGVPTVGDFLPGFEASVWLGIGAPKNTPAEIIEKLNKELGSRYKCLRAFAQRSSYRITE